MARAQACAVRNTPLTFVRWTASNSASAIPSKPFSVTTPALQTAMSMRPHAEQTAAAMAATSSGCVTSQGTANTSALVAEPISSAASASLCASRAIGATRAPDCA